MLQRPTLDNSNQLNDMARLYLLKKRLALIPSTIVLYDIYSTAADLFLHNLHVLARLLVDPKQLVTVTRKVIKKMTRYVYSVAAGTDDHKKSGTRLTGTETVGL